MKKKTIKKKQPSTKIKQVNFRITQEAKAQLEKEAEEFNISVSAYIAVILSQRRFVVDKIRGGEIIIAAP